MNISRWRAKICRVCCAFRVCQSRRRMSINAGDGEISVNDLPPNASEFIVVRHGETEWNAAGIMQGQACSELNDVGRDQARAVAHRLATEQVQVAAVYSSDLKRAADTAEIIASKCHYPEVTLIATLRERHLGKLQGLSRKEARKVEPKAYQALCSSLIDQPIPGGGESLNQLCQRSKLALETIAKKHYGERVVLVTHGGVLRTLHYHAKGFFPSGRVLNASMSIFRITDGNDWNLRSWGDVQGVISARSSSDPDSA